ncbi:hypothetical protein NDU88_008812 [Pleurodeles waltl]|uniref:Uncharacterized protein n=1 Tax=Pleurodeles waltl TaxID=8319 RepID=A0AAV7PXQ5_PLEWA|nr:hypothetical protein NDU88_008812 [Pleurodeles waltl]
MRIVLIIASQNIAKRGSGSGDSGDKTEPTVMPQPPRFNKPPCDGPDARCLKDPLLLPELLASRSAAVERKTANLEKQEDEDDGESRAESSGSSSGVEVTVLSAEYTAEE